MERPKRPGEVREQWAIRGAEKRQLRYAALPQSKRWRVFDEAIARRVTTTVVDVVGDIVLEDAADVAFVVVLPDLD